MNGQLDQLVNHYFIVQLPFPDYFHMPNILGGLVCSEFRDINIFLALYSLSFYDFAVFVPV